MPHPTIVAAVRHPELGRLVALDPATNYADDDVLVAAYPWAFAPLEAAAGEIIESVSIEKATAEPGAKRGLFRRG